MALPTTAGFGDILVKLGDGASPETFTAPCGFISKALNLIKNLNETDLPDCDDPDLAGWLARDVLNKSAAINGEGVLASESVAAWKAAWESDSPVNCRVEIDLGGTTHTFACAFHIATFNISGQRGGRVSVNVEMQSDGALVWTSA